VHSVGVARDNCLQSSNNIVLSSRLGDLYNLEVTGLLVEHLKLVVGKPLSHLQVQVLDQVHRSMILVDADGDVGLAHVDLAVAVFVIEVDADGAVILDEVHWDDVGEIDLLHVNSSNQHTDEVTSTSARTESIRTLLGTFTEGSELQGLV